MTSTDWNNWLRIVETLKNTLKTCTTQEQVEEVLELLTPEERERLLYTWRYWARDNQLEPESIASGEKTVWMILSGRGWGKSFSASNYLIEKVLEGYKRIAIVGETAGEIRDVNIEGPSGILAVAPPWFRPTYEPSKRRITFPNGAIATTYAAESYEQLRGPNHDFALVDELAKFRNDQEVFDQLMLTLRLEGPGGKPPVCMITTTPRPTALIRDLVKDPQVHVTRGSTYENKSNLAPAFLNKIERMYANTRMGRQELYAELLDDLEGALWNHAMIDQARMLTPELDPERVHELGMKRALAEQLELSRLVIAVDPAVTANKDSDETGIVVAGANQQDQAFVLDDKSGIYSPNEWAKIVVKLYNEWGADIVVAESNQGGDLVKTNILSESNIINVQLVRATRGKVLRAEPVVGLYEQNRVKHLGSFTELHDQMTTWVPSVNNKSPDRVDALVYAVTALLLTNKQETTTGGVLV